MNDPARATSRIVVIGGYGNFGARICRALAGERRFEVIAASRCSPRGPVDPRVSGVRLDVASTGFPRALERLAPRVVIHCAGLFQNQDYRVALAAVAVGAHYIDLADGRDFVTGFADSVDAPARANSVVALSGASTLPALSSAVVDDLIGRFRELREIEIAIAPGQRAPRGKATIAAVLSYAGKPFQWLSRGRWTTVWGWQELRIMRIGESNWRLAAACDVPDLVLFPARYPTVHTVTFRAALESKVQHLGIWMVAALRRIGIALPVERGAATLDRLASMFDRFGGETGGMVVALAGTRDDGKAGCVEWHLTAKANRGPEIPCMAAILLARKLLEDDLSLVGAFPCMGFLRLRDFEPEFERWQISCAVKETEA